MKQSLILSKNNTILLIIDVQKKLMPVISNDQNIVENISRLISTFQILGMPIVLTEQYPKGLGGTVEQVRKLIPTLTAVPKNEFAATDNPEFWSHINIHKPNAFVICGVETHVCVSQTVIRLIEKEIQVHVVADAVGSRHLLDHEMGLKKMERAGAILSTTEMCLFELAEKAGTETFKSIQQLVKKTTPLPSCPSPLGARLS
jgi:nicotinamidase-related amidase